MALCARPGLTLPHAAPRPASQLILRCINATQSAYLSLTFHARYFETYDVFNQDVVQAGVLMKVREVQPPRARPWSGGPGRAGCSPLGCGFAGIAGTRAICPCCVP